MLLTWLLAIPAIFGLGYGLRIAFAPSWHSSKSITRNEWILGSVLAILVGIPVSTVMTDRWARQNEATFTEFWNGVELRAVEIPITCTRDGPCWHEYSCDPYTVTYSCNCDDDGCDTCTRTEYHDCPYVTREFNYVVNTSIGDFTIAQHRFPFDPDRHRWRERHEVPARVARDAGIGPPQFWIEAKERLDRNMPWGVTKEVEYTNYVLAAQQTLLAPQAFRAAEKWSILIPQFDPEIYSFYKADKVYEASPVRYDRRAWLEAVAQFNAVYSTLQGDLHLVLVNTTELTGVNSVQPDEFAIAVRTAFMDTEKYPRQPLAKNTTVVILGTDGATVEWARMFTGMPEGNEAAVVAVRDRLKGTLFLPDSVIGKITWSGSVPQMHGGQLVNILLRDKTTRFERTHMSKFQYLFNDIPVPLPWRFVAAFLAALFSLPVWAVMYNVGVETPRIPRWRGYR